MIRTVHLHGSLKERFGGPFRVDAATIQEIGSYLRQYPGLVEHMAEGRFCVVRGDLETGHAIDADLLGFRLGKTTEVHILPEAEGARRGIGKAIVGAVIIGVSIWASGGALSAPLMSTGLLSNITFGQVMMTGVSLALSGAAQMLSPQPSAGDYTAREAPDQRASHNIRGPVNRAEEGGPLPIIVGFDVLFGDIVVSAGATSERI